MIQTSELYKSIFSQEGHYKEWRISVNGQVYGQDVIVKEIDGQDCAPLLSRPTFIDTPSIGSCYAAQFMCTFLLPSGQIPRMATVKPSYRLRYEDQASEWVELGTFYVDVRNYDKASQTTQLTCYDDMLKTDGEGGKPYAELTSLEEWPQPMSVVVSDISSITGIPLDPRTLIRSGAGYMVGYPNNYTMREVLGYVAAAHGGNFIISPQRGLRLIPLVGSSEEASLIGEADLSLAEEFSAWSKVTVYYADEEGYESGNDTGRSIEAEDPWAEQDTADGILSVLSGNSYQPFNSEQILLDPAVEIGDLIRVPGTLEEFHLWSIEVVCDATAVLSVGASGESAVDHEYPYVSSSARQMRRMVKLGQPYYGVTISKKSGIEIKRSDGTSEAVFNSDTFAMRALIDGVMKDRIYFDSYKGDYIFDGALGADAVFADSLYAKNGDIAELTVDRLSTSRRVRKYLLGDTSDDNYIKIQDNYIRFVTGKAVSGSLLTTESGIPIATENGLLLTSESVDYARTQATNRYGEGLYWQREPVGHTADGYPLDADGKQIYASTGITDWPVYTYLYLELIKAQYAFEQIGAVYQPQIILGAGDENGNSKGYVFKTETGLLMQYITSQGKAVDVAWTDDGFVDADHRRLKSCLVNISAGTVIYQLEGDANIYSLRMAVDEDSITYTWPDGFECVVSVQ